MTNPDFAELRDKLCLYDLKEVMNSKELIKSCHEDDFLDGVMYQNTKSAAIITELLEIISLQNKEVESYARYIYCTETCHLSTRWSDHAKCTCGAEKLKNSVKQSLSETNTRLQKLREGTK